MTSDSPRSDTMFAADRSTYPPDRPDAQWAQLYDLFMQAPVPICVMRGPDLVYEMANPAYFRVAGRDDLLGKPLLEALPEFRGQGYDNFLREVMRTGVARAAEESLLLFDRNGDGNLEDTFWTFVYAPLRNSAGEADRVVAFCHDVTDQVRSRMERELTAAEARRNEERIAGILRQASVGIAQTDLEGRFVLVNDRYCEMLGRSREELLRLRMQDVTHPDDLQPNVMRFRELARTGRDFIIEKRYLKPDATVVQVRNSVYAVRDASGAPEYAVAVSVDITDSRQSAEALQQSERRHRRIFESAGVSIWEEDFSRIKVELDMLRAQGVRNFSAYFDEHPDFVERCIELVRIVDVNRATLRLFGARTKSELLRSLTTIFEPQTEAVFKGELLAVADGRESFEAEAVLRTLDGTHLNVLVSITFPPPDDDYSSVLVTLTDITMRKRAEQEREQLLQAAEAARREAELANHSKAQFLAAMSHELRTPLNAIMAYADLIDAGVSGPLTEKQKTHVGRIDFAARHLLQLIEGILTFSRIEAGREELHLDTASLVNVLREATDLIEPLATQKGLKLVRKFPDQDVELVTDAAKVKQILFNLLSNAIKFTAAGTVSLTAAVRNERAVIEVCDTGEGIEPEHVGRIFDAFVQVPQSQRDRRPGAGLGLPVSRQLATLLQGTIDVSSEPGQGSKFTVILPLRAIPEQAL